MNRRPWVAPGGRGRTALVTARLIVARQRPDKRAVGGRETDDDGSPFPDPAASRGVPRAYVYPGPVGELIARELLSWDEFGHRLGGNQMIMRLVEHVLWAPAAGPRTQPR